MAEIGKRQIELLAPAGSYEIFSAVLKAGADAVYLGGSRFGARAYANNFSEEELRRAIDEAHIHGRQLYLTVNTLFKEEELEGELYEYLLPYYEQGLDAVIVQDIGAIRFIREAFPGLDIHTSTQMTVANRYGAEFMKELGANRVVTAREMSLEEIRDIHEHVEVEIESFVHGALCYCYSGQCLLSSMLGGRSGNRGRCAQPCRLPYEVCDGKRKAVSDIKGRKLKENYILSPKDMCTIELLPELVESGVYSFKIEGRMKQAEYAAGVVSVYRSYVDKYLVDLERFGDAVRAKENYRVSKEDNRKLVDFGNRSGFTEGYYKRHNGRDMITFEKPNHAKGNEALQEEIMALYPKVTAVHAGYLKDSNEEQMTVVLEVKEPLSKNNMKTLEQWIGKRLEVEQTIIYQSMDSILYPAGMEKEMEKAGKKAETEEAATEETTAGQAGETEGQEES